MIRREIHDGTKISKSNVGVYHIAHKVQKKSNKAGDTGYTAFTGFSNGDLGCRATRFTNHKYSDMRFSYIKSKLFDMELDKMDLKCG